MATPRDDELFSPTIRNEPLPRPAPYRVGSNVYVGFFGGPVAASLVAAVNARRLSVRSEARRNVLLVGLVFVVLTLVVAFVVPADANARAVRLPVQLLGAVCAVVQSRFLVSRERYWQGRGVTPASLWGFGFVAVLGAGVVNALLITLARAGAS